MEQIERAGVSGQWVQYNQFTFKNVTSDLKKVEDPEMQKYFEDNCVIFNPTPEERLEHWQPYFSGAALSSSPLMADVKAEMDAQAKDAIGQFFDGNLSEEGLSQTFQNLYQKLTDACKERGYPLPLWDTYMPPAALSGLYDEFRYQILDAAVQRNNQEGRQYVTGEMTANRNWKYYNSDYYFKSEEAISAVTDKFLSMTQENQWEDILSVPDYKGKGFNLYYNFNSALSNHFVTSDQYVMDTDQVPPKDFRWFYYFRRKSKENRGRRGKMEGMEYIDLRKVGREGLKEIRRQVVRLKELGKTGKEIEELTGVRQNRASEIWTAYQREGSASLERKKYGRKPGTHMALTPKEQENVRKAIVEKVPEEFGITGRLWTLGRTREYIRKEFHKTISERTLSDYMKRWGMSCQRPVKRARRQNPQGI